MSDSDGSGTQDEQPEARDPRPYRDTHPRRPKKPLNTDRKAWHRQDGESIQAFEAFMAFLTLASDERTLRKTAAIVGKSLSLMRQWSKQWHWQNRAANYEEHYALLRLESVEAKRDDMWVRHESLGNTAMAIVEAQFEGLLAAINARDENGNILNPEALKPDALVRLFSEAVKVHRMSVLGRVDSIRDRAEAEEKLADQFADELTDLMRTVLHESGVDEQKIQEVLAKHLLAEQAN